MKPFFTHDCDKCKHLGSVHIKDTAYDLYVCSKGILAETLIARWSDEGQDYYSTPTGSVDPVYSAAALRMAYIAYHGEYYEQA